MSIRALAREIEARRTLEQHLNSTALGGNHPVAVAVPRDSVQALLDHRCERKEQGDWIAICPSGEIFGPFESLTAADIWTAAQPDGDLIAKATLQRPEAAS